MSKAKHDRFIAEYLIDSNATQAARRAGYRRAHQTGSDLLRRPEIAAEIKHREAELVVQVEKKAQIFTRVAARSVPRRSRLLPCARRSMPWEKSRPHRGTSRRTSR